MSIKRYNEKRNFKDTPEPVGKTAASNGKGLRFVIQKHEASHLHYDFRLELNGVLLSWAVPKGPSLNPEDKRLAMHVEDHPMDYRRFEGIIPEGNYGAGTVMVWDEGTYSADPALDRKANEKALTEAYKKGKMTFSMSGTKLRGEFTLIKMHGRNRSENAWLLIKADDEAADRDSDIRDRNTSVISGRPMEAIAADADDVWHSKDKTAAKKNSRTTATIGSSSAGKKRTPLNLASAALAIGGKKSAMPAVDGPQLAVLVDAPFDREDWIFEIKWDGYRALGFHPAKDGISLLSRNGKSFDSKFALIRDALQSLPCTAIVDGEIVALEQTGKSSFEKLQKHEMDPANLVYYIFDLLFVDGVDIRKLPLLERKKLLTRLLASCDAHLQYSDHIETKGVEFFEAARQNALEGIIAKNGLAAYQQGERSRHWLKIKIEQRQEFIIAGYTAPRGSRSDFGSLILAYYSRAKAQGGIGAGKLRYAGHVGTGLDTKTRAELKEKLDRLAVKTIPFADKPATNAPTTWVKPVLVCEVRYTEKTDDCHLRHPVFIAMREDKDPRDIHWDVAEKTAPAVDDASDEAEAGQQKASVGRRASRKAVMGAAAPAGKKTGKPPSTKAGSKRSAVKTSARNAVSRTAVATGSKKAQSRPKTKTKAKTKTKTKTGPKAAGYLM